MRPLAWFLCGRGLLGRGQRGQLCGIRRQRIAAAANRISTGATLRRYGAECDLCVQILGNQVQVRAESLQKHLLNPMPTLGGEAADRVAGGEKMLH